MAAAARQYIREVLHHTEAPPPVQPRYFYTSPLAIDDPLSPLPPPATGGHTYSGKPPRPFSDFDNDALDKSWHELRKRILNFNEDGGEKGKPVVVASEEMESKRSKGKQISEVRGSSLDSARRLREATSHVNDRERADSMRSDKDVLQSSSLGDHRSGERYIRPNGNLRSSLDSSDTTSMPPDPDITNTTGTPFIRAPSRRDIPKISSLRGFTTNAARPEPHALDSYEWDESAPLHHKEPENPPCLRQGPTAKVPVGVSRLHNVVMPEMNMQPIYWSPVNDIAPVVRGTWFYKDTMLPVETAVANMLEVGYIELQVWTDTWQDEMNSAIEVGAAGEEKIVHPLWPETRKEQPESRPSTARGEVTGMVATTLIEPSDDTPEKRRVRDVEAACDIIDVVSGIEGTDNKAAGTVTYGRYGEPRTYATCGIMYVSTTDAVILKPSLMPSAYYGRRPLANYIRKNRKIGIPVVRGFDQAEWDKLYPIKISPKAAKAYDGVSSAQAGAPTNKRQGVDAELSQSSRPNVTDLILVIHGIGQKLSERVESYHFTHAMNSFRREVSVELGTDSVKAHLDPDGGGIMLLPVNWRHNLSFEEGGYRDENTNAGTNTFSLKDITPDTLPSVRNIVSDVMLDIPYYLSHHQPKMIAAVIREANRIYQLWCANNPGFAEHGRVHLLAHSLGSVMAIDILSAQPTKIPERLRDPTKINLDKEPISHFMFNTSNLFLAGSPAGFFLLLKKATLTPRLDHEKPDADPAANTHLVCSGPGTYGCLALDNIYNVINPYDPVSYRLNAAVDATYARTLKAAWIPSASSGWLSGSSSWFGKSKEGAYTSALSGPLPGALPRLPSNVELETHNFTREEVAEQRMHLLNDNGQIDYLLRYGGGPLEIQYLTMLGAHSSYWLLRDFVRLIVIEIGRKKGRSGVLNSMKAQKRKTQLD